MGGMGTDALAVIGTAGRQDDGPRITRPLYDAMYGHVLRARDDWAVRTLVSGGAAVADHLAVRAFLEGQADALILHLPAPFEGGRFVKPPRAVNDDAGTANRYHRQFSEACGLDSLGELVEAIRRGAMVHVGAGFLARNADVARRASHMLALTFGALREPADLDPDHPAFMDPKAAGVKDGGTARTYAAAWRCRVKRHVSLNWLERQMAAAPSGPSGPR